MEIILFTLLAMLVIYVGPISGKVYTSNLERVEALEVNARYVRDWSVARVRPLLRSAPYTLALNFTLLAPAHNNVTIRLAGLTNQHRAMTLMDVIKIVSEEYVDKSYKKGFIQITKRLCDFIDQDKIIYPILKRNSNLPDKCPVLPDTYRFDNIHVGQTFMLSAAPFRKLRLKLVAVRTDSSEVMFGMHIYLTYVERKLL